MASTIANSTASHFSMEGTSIAQNESASTTLKSEIFSNSREEVTIVNSTDAMEVLSAVGSARGYSSSSGCECRQQTNITPFLDLVTLGIALLALGIASGAIVINNGNNGNGNGGGRRRRDAPAVGLNFHKLLPDDHAEGFIKILEQLANTYETDSTPEHEVKCDQFQLCQLNKAAAVLHNSVVSTVIPLLSLPFAQLVAINSMSPSVQSSPYEYFKAIREGRTGKNCRELFPSTCNI